MGPVVRMIGSGGNLRTSEALGLGRFVNPNMPDLAIVDGPNLLFAYGTLGPRGLGAVGNWVADRVRGRLFDLGPYPALIDWDDPEAGWVEGHVRAVDRAELECDLDPYEGVDEGLFRRIIRATEAGRRVWAYGYLRPLPATARGPLNRWDSPRHWTRRGGWGRMPRSSL